MRRTRIVCSLGPASATPSVVRRLVGAGMDVARCNFSHGDAAGYRTSVQAVRDAARAANRSIALLQDLQGPKVRTGPLQPAQLKLTRGQQVTLTSRPVTGHAGLIPVSHQELIEVLRPRDHILLADGQIDLIAREVGATDAVCGVVRGGVLEARKGVIAPGRPLALPALTQKDLVDVREGAALDFDYVALSFVRGPDDVNACRQALAACGRCTPVIAKLERVEALRNLDRIIDCVDGVMVARGDLGVEMSLAAVPAIQKDIIERCNRAGVPVITATEMLESMVSSNRPTRAEASDVANAIWDGTDAVMLSQETSIGAHPVEAVQAMARICEAAERHPAYLRARGSWREPGSIAGAMAQAAATVAEETGARVILAFTESGATARRVSKARPAVPIIAASPHPEVLRRTALYAGVVPLQIRPAADTDDLIAQGTRAAVGAGLVRSGDRITFVAGVPVGEPGQTNLVKVEVVA
jgi:pyruvate kinase